MGKNTFDYIDFIKNESTRMIVSAKDISTLKEYIEGRTEQELNELIELLQIH